MKTLISKIKSRLRSNSGETIVETIVAFTICLIFLAGLSQMITTSLRISGLYTRESTVFQEDVVNKMMVYDYTSNATDIATEPGEITLEGGFSSTSSGTSQTYTISVTQDATIARGASGGNFRGIFAFAPEVGP